MINIQGIPIRLKDLTTANLERIHEQIEHELYQRLEAKREVCTHPKYIDIMWRPGAFYRGCSNCQTAETVIKGTTGIYTDEMQAMEELVEKELA